MTSSDETHRQIQHVLLDMLAAVDVDGGTLLPDGWIKPFTADLQRIGAVHATVEETDVDRTVKIDISPLMDALLPLIEVLVQDVAKRAEQDRLVVINAVRVTMDELAADDD